METQDQYNTKEFLIFSKSMISKNLMDIKPKDRLALTKGIITRLRQVN